MGFDNECILNIQSLPGEYFCPVCRTLVYPNEALQSQCTHIYCKPCLAYIVTTTRACPYDGYLVTEADSKPLTESNTSLAETIGKVAVHCLYYRSGCQWQGGLSESITHCAECNFGTSAVICNRCGTQIMHRQVQEHGLTCPGMQPQAQQTESQTQDSKVQGQAVAPDQSSAASAAPASVAPTTASSAVPATAVTAAPPAPSTTAGATASQGQIQSNAVLYLQAPVQTPTPEQWYQQQYQQYYQQFPGYDPYQQYQQYAQYQQQVHPQYAQQMQQVVPQQVIQGQQQQPQYLMPQPQVQPQPQTQPLAQLQPHPQTQSQPHPQAQLQPQAQPHPQAQLQPQAQPHPQAQLQPHPQSQPQPQLRPQLPLQPQAQPPHQLPPQSQPQLQTLVPHQQTHGQVIPPHPQHQYPQSQLPPQIQAPVQQLHTAQQPHPHAHPQSHPPPHAQFGGQQPLQPQARPHLPQPQPQHMPPQQHPHAQMQHPQFHAPQQPLPQPHSVPQHQQPHQQPQPFVQPQPQHPSAQAVSGHQSYPQPQPGQQLLPSVPQRPMQVPPQLNPQNQFPQQQTLQVHPPHAQLPMQVQQYSNAMPPQGSQVPMGSGQQQAHHLVPQGQQIHQHPGMQLHAHPQGTHAQHHPGQSLPMHPQQPAHGQQYMQQQAPVQPTQGMQPPHLQSPATPSKPTHSAVNQQSPNKSYASLALQSGSQPSTLFEEKIKQFESTDLKIPKSEIDSKSDDNREEATEERKSSKSQKDGTLDESAEQMHEKGLETNMKDEQTKDHVPKKEDASEPSGKPGQGEGSDVHKLPDGARTVQPEIIDSQGQRTENVAKNTHAPSEHLLQPQNHLHGPQPGSNQERKLPGPPPYPPQVFGQVPMPNQMGPSLRNNPDPFPYQGAPSIPQESFQPPIGKMPHGSYPSEVPHQRLAGPGLPPSSGVAPGPMGHHQNYMPPPHGLGPSNFQGPPSGPGGSAFAMENQMGRSHPGAPGQQAPFGHPHPMPTNGISSIASHGVPKERFGPAPEESLRPFPDQLKMHREEHFVPSTIDLKRFEEDMKRFPRPDHLDREGRHPFGPDSRPLPLGRSGGHADFGDRLRPLGHRDDLGRNHDLLISSGGEYTGSWPGKFGLGNQSNMNDFANRERQGFGDRSKAFPLKSAGFPRSPGSGSLGYFDGPGSLRKDIDGNLTGRHIDIAEPGYGSRHGFPSETKPSKLFSHPGGMDPFEFSRVRKPGSLGLCRICKIDCETVEGLDLHSQTREHQKMAMNMVLSIKQENAKRHKLNSEGNAPFEESSRMRKPSFESHLSWT